MIATIGLEVHAQLLTATKIFCGCSAAFGAKPTASQGLVIARSFYDALGGHRDVEEPERDLLRRLGRRRLVRLRTGAISDIT